MAYSVKYISARFPQNRRLSTAVGLVFRGAGCYAREVADEQLVI